MKPYDAIILGGGIAGLSAARELAKLKQRVLLLEREETGGKTSRAAAGILDPYTEAEEETPLFQIGLKALDFYPSLLREIAKRGPADVEFEKLGILYLALSGEDEKFLKDRFKWQRKQGLPVQLLSSEEIRKREPGVSEGTRSGIFYPEIPKLNANKLTQLLLEATRASGVEIHSSVKDVSVWIEGDQVRGVESSLGRIESPVVVLARGAWESMNQKIAIKIAMQPVRGQILLLRADASFCPRHMFHTIRWAYIVPWPDNRLLIGSTLESAGFDDRVTPEGKKDILDRVSEISERIREFPIESSWAGLRPKSTEGTPVIGPTRVRGLFFASGYYRSGILIGPLVGKLLAEGIVSGKFSPLLKPFYPGGDEE